MWKMVDGTILELLLWSTIALIGLLEILRLLLAATFAAGWRDYKSILGQCYENMRGESWKNSRQVLSNNMGEDVKDILLSEQQVERIRARKWKEVLAWIAFHPDELLRVDRKRRTALHFACLVQAPVQVIEMMLFQAPDLAFMSNDDSELPLHWAVRLSASKEIIKWLLTVNPASACIARDREGNTPLSLTWERHEQALVNSLWTQNRETIPQDPRWQRVILFLKAYDRHTESKECLPGEDEVEIPAELTAHLAQPLHLACRCPSCPTSLFSFLLVLYRNSIGTKDTRGFLPLHYACLDYRSNRSIGALTKIDLLLNEHPHSASEPEDSSGRIPLFLALRGGISWEEGVMRLIEAVPRSLQATDTPTQLPAFAVAAMEQVTENKAENEPRHLTLIFKLLRKDPSMITEQRQGVQF